MRFSASTHGSKVVRTLHRAFTFLEIMFVVVIIGILMGVAMVNISKRSQQARINTTLLQMASFDTALGQFEVHVGRYPETREGLQALITRPSSVAESMWDGPYLKLKGGELPRDRWGNAFGYRSPGTHNADYDLWSLGPDGREGTEDDITNWGGEGS